MAAYISVIGNLTRDPETRMAGKGSVTNLNIGTSATRKDQAGNKQSIYFSASVFGAPGEACSRYLKKGSKVFIQGEFVPNEYKSQTGDSRVAFNINNASVEFLDSAQQGDNNGAGQPTTQYKKAPPAAPAGAVGGEEDLPF